MKRRYYKANKTIKEANLTFILNQKYRKEYETDERYFTKAQQKELDEEEHKNKIAHTLCFLDTGLKSDDYLITREGDQGEII